jgi:molybdopterin converting factor small subunit
MRVTVEALPWLGEAFGGTRSARHTFEVEVEEGATLATLLHKLASEHASFKRVVYEPRTGDFSERILVALNDHLPELLEGYETPLHPGDRVTLMQAYAGGA